MVTGRLSFEASRDVCLGEAELEMPESDCLRSLPVMYVPVLDPAESQGLRAFVERNAIALLASQGGRIDLPTAEWLGLTVRRLPSRLRVSET